LARIQTADPIARKKAMGIIFMGTVTGLAAIGLYTHYEMELSSWLENNIDWLASNPWTVFLFGLVLVTPLLILSGYLFIYGRRTAKTGRIPPPNYALVQETRVATGTKAVLRGKIVQVLSVFLLLSSAAIPILFWYILSRFA